MGYKRVSSDKILISLQDSTSDLMTPVIPSQSSKKGLILGKKGLMSPVFVGCVSFFSDSHYALLCQYNGLKSIPTCHFVPQTGHPKTRAFITHGGTNGLYEAIYHGIPMVGVPIFADQPDNIAHMQAKGAALKVNFNTLTSADLLKALRAVINEPS